ncbi:pentapeptide repeat-containing protein [Chelativorans sp. M5D2P16]|uniref:pentapeptide repeat-containing protein n=1 Tax=Chelativorans sp. M5D2P16 TaxID=3095678 RepID=UPI002ACA16FC|nr:pentapeptide repeat-containing protein [Chelativorans sp. M5D2P16]MDZ5698694.1 pentapeptide repeat-containing protein [Chelativorans sp. M5D2P16]
MLVLVAGVSLVVTLYLAIPGLQDGFFNGVFVEFNGMLFDVVVFGILIALFVRAMERRREVQRQQEIIDDYKKWNSDEGRFRIAGAIRRLNRFGKTDIDFGGIEVSDFSFRRHDIRSIRGSTFYDGTWGEMGSRDDVKLERVDFHSVDCREVVFSKFHPFAGFTLDIVFASIKDCNFAEADLANAVFKGAHLKWTEEHPDELGIWHEFPDEPPAFQQTHYPPFWRADLQGASFVDATFKNADFRGADGVLECDFTGAKGLESAIFDDDEVKKSVLRMSQSTKQGSRKAKERHQ